MQAGTAFFQAQGENPHLTPCLFTGLLPRSRVVAPSPSSKASRHGIFHLSWSLTALPSHISPTTHTSLLFLARALGGFSKLPPHDESDQPHSGSFTPSRHLYKSPCGALIGKPNLLLYLLSVASSFLILSLAHLNFRAFIWGRARGVHLPLNVAGRTSHFHVY